MTKCSRYFHIAWSSATDQRCHFQNNDSLPLATACLVRTYSTAARQIDKLYNFVSGLRWCAVENVRKILVHYVLCNACAWLWVKSKDKQYGSMCLFKTTSSPIRTDLVQILCRFCVIVYNVAICSTPSIFCARISKPYERAMISAHAILWWTQIIYIACFPK